jgi:predicted molibdopterin-dependent oxidoreductase YjgC
VVVNELFRTATALSAHVVFSATATAEKDGSLTNIEGRLQRIFQAARPAAGTHEDWWILTELSAEMGASLGYASAVEVTRELLTDLPVYATAGGTIPAQGIVSRTDPAAAANQWATSTAAAPAGGSGSGLRLLTYSELLGDETVVRGTPQLLQMVPEPYIELNPADAERFGISAEQTVTVSTAKGSVERVAKINGRCPQGVCFSPDNSGLTRINALLDWGDPQPRVSVVPVAAAVAGAGVSA